MNSVGTPAANPYVPSLRGALATKQSRGRCLALRGLPRTRFRTILSALADRRPEFPMPRAPCVYIMANDRNGTLYTGVLSNLSQRIHQYCEGLGEGFARWPADPDRVQSRSPRRTRSLSVSTAET